MSQVCRFLLPEHDVPASIGTTERVLVSTEVKTYAYVYTGGSLMQETIETKLTTDDGTTTNSQTLNYAYDVSGAPMTVTYGGATYYYALNLQGDVMAVLNTSGTAVVTYTYDAWGNILTTSGTMAATLGKSNALTYRGYVYDNETGLYYLQSRYYNPETGRFINGDDPGYLGVNGLLSYNLFTYCSNNPVMGYDPTGAWDWGGVLVGLGLIAAGIWTYSNFGTTTLSGGLVATGAVMVYTAATDGAMVMDVSVAKPGKQNIYGKAGGTVLIDFEGDEAYFYSHYGTGEGNTSGLSYSVGIVGNYAGPDSYAKHFIDVNGSLSNGIGIDFCCDPTKLPWEGTNATSICFGMPGTPSGGVGYDYYMPPQKIFSWNMED